MRINIVAPKETNYLLRKGVEGAILRWEDMSNHLVLSLLLVIGTDTVRVAEEDFSRGDTLRVRTCSGNESRGFSLASITFLISFSSSFFFLFSSLSPFLLRFSSWSSGIFLAPASPARDSRDLSTDLLCAYVRDELQARERSPEIKILRTLRHPLVEYITH